MHVDLAHTYNTIADRSKTISDNVGFYLRQLPNDILTTMLAIHDILDPKKKFTQPEARTPYILNQLNTLNNYKFYYNSRRRYVNKAAIQKSS